MRIVTIVTILLLLATLPAIAQDPERPIPGKTPAPDDRSAPNPWRIKPKVAPLEPAEKPGIFPASGPEYHARAGWPLCLRPHALPSDTGAYVGYLVGGGCPVSHLADAPTINEGAWGWDYTGCWFHCRVIAGWWHGRCYQGGFGAYETNGPSFDHGEATLHEHPEKGP